MLLVLSDKCLQGWLKAQACAGDCQKRSSGPVSGDPQASTPALSGEASPLGTVPKGLEDCEVQFLIHCRVWEAEASSSS